MFCLQVENFLDEIRQSSLVVIDGNIPVETIDYVLRVCKTSRIPGRERHYLILIGYAFELQLADVDMLCKGFCNSVPCTHFLLLNVLIRL
jgi:hypothetical protein